MHERRSDIGARTIRFQAEGGRIVCSPTRLNIGDHEVVLSGSTGFDQTLDYLVQVPVTEDLVGSSVFPYLEGTTLKVPVAGTVTRPRIDERALLKAVGDLTGQAATKALKEEAGRLLEKLFE